MRLGAIEVQSQSAKTEQLTMLLWGKPACGKTVLASTAPGKKLWLLFDPNGTASLPKRDDILVADFSTYNTKKMADFKQGGSIERDLLDLFKQDKIDTVIIDSVTSFTQLAMRYAIEHKDSSNNSFKSSIESPGLRAYGTRTALTVDFLLMVEMVSRSNGCHFIIIAHDMETYDSKQEIESITMSLKGGAADAIPPRISEIWRVEDTGRERLVYVRNHGLHKPMRTRMFITPDGQSRFKWTYDQQKGTGHGIEDYYKSWKEAGYNKVNLPV